MGCDVAVVPVVDDDTAEVVELGRFSVMVLMLPPPPTFELSSCKVFSRINANPRSAAGDRSSSRLGGGAWTGFRIGDLSPLAPGCGVVVGEIESMFIPDLDPMGADTCPAETMAATVEVTKSDSDPKLAGTTSHSSHSGGGTYRWVLAWASPSTQYCRTIDTKSFCIKGLVT